jgi:hypothetical protein
VGWGNLNNARFISNILADSTRQQGFASRPGEASGLRTFRVRDNRNVVFWAVPGQLTPFNTDSLAVAVMGNRPGGGRMIYTSVPISTSIPLTNSRAPALLPKILKLLGVIP